MELREQRVVHLLGISYPNGFKVRKPFSFEEILLFLRRKFSGNHSVVCKLDERIALVQISVLRSTEDIL